MLNCNLTFNIVKMMLYVLYWICWFSIWLFLKLSFNLTWLTRKFWNKERIFYCLLHPMGNIIGQNQINCFYGLDNVPGRLEPGYFILIIIMRFRIRSNFIMSKNANTYGPCQLSIWRSIKLRFNDQSEIIGT